MKARAWIWIGGIVVFLLLCTGVLFFMAGPKSASNYAPLKLPAPIALARFDDGSELQILGIGSGTLEEGATTRPAGAFWEHLQWGSSGGASGVDRVYFNQFTLKNERVGLRFSALPAGLLVQSRLLDPAGQPIRPTRIYDGGYVRGIPGVPEMPGTFKGSAAMLDPAADKTALPEILIQLSDGRGGWANLDGPGIDKDPQSRLISFISSWPHDSATLKFRAIKPGNAPAEFTLPDPRPAPASGPGWKADPIPTKFEDPEFSLALEAVLWEPRSENWPLLVPTVKLISKIEPGGGPSKMLNLNLERIEDDLGDHSLSESLTFAGKRPGVNGFPFPKADEKLYRLHCVVGRTPLYASSISRCTILAEGTVAADGNSLVLTSPSGRLGVQSLTTKVGSGYDRKPGFDIEIKGGGSQSNKVANDAPHGPFDRWAAAVFLDEDMTSLGEVRISGRSSSGSEGSYEFKLTGRWNGTLKPGQKIRIGVMRPEQATDVYFTIDRASVK